MTRRFHTKTFEKIDEARRESILSVAIREFADKGFNGTSINGLARKAGVSIGSLYSYFHSKDELFLTVCAKGHDLLEHALSDIDPSRGLFSEYRTMLTRARDYAKSNPELNLIYLDATTQGLRHLAKRLSSSLESVTAKLYERLLEAAARTGEIRRDIEPGAAAFCLDNLIVLFQFSFCSDYYRDRLRIFLGLADDQEIDEDGLIEAILDFVQAAMKGKAL
ncbi:MAG TPA: TetR/AcrR family transcriptional regulator [Spirochaetia bacterium]|nr:TetR/AcrR family transcriptional regulator [Spirochaetia bacterium]